jgi:hypothetical protein
MLIRFNITNFLSFNQETEFNMLAATSLRTHKDHVYSIKKDIHVLKASTIYGANGAGKSNMIKALAVLQNIVLFGKIFSAVSKHKFKFQEENQKLPIQLEIEFSTADDKIYTYGIAFDDNMVLEEWLYRTGSGKPKAVFERVHSAETKLPSITTDPKFVQTDKNQMLISLMEENLLKPDELFISKNDSLKYDEIKDVLEWFKNDLFVIYPDSKGPEVITGLNQNEGFRAFSNELFQSFDLGIQSLDLKSRDLDELVNQYLMDRQQVEHIKKVLDIDEQAGGILERTMFGAFKEGNQYVAKTIVSNHAVGNSNYIFDMEDESDGTQRLIDFLPMIYGLLETKRTFVIDELDRSLHPSILHKLIHKIMDNSNIKGQLIFTTHESSLLNCNIFRADEIWFAQKNKEEQSTQLYTLHEFKPRADLDIEKGYLNGRFGAIPFLAKLDDLNW